MNALYFYSHNDGEFRAANVESLEQLTSIINQDFNICFLDFLRYRTSIIDSYLLKRWQGTINYDDIQLILDALGFRDNHVTNGAQFNDFLLKNSMIKKYLFTSAFVENPSLKDELCLKYLKWVFNNYIRIFNKHYGELVLIVSDDKPINRLPDGLHLIKFKGDKRNFYSTQDVNKAKEICLACGAINSGSNILDFKSKGS